MALRRVTVPYAPTQAEVQTLAQIQPHTADYWDLNRNAIKDLKNNIRDHLMQIQNERCCYCGGVLRETSPDEIDHVAPKSLHGVFVFEPLNLVLACHYCNGFHKKSDEDTVQPPRQANYRSNRFTIVHPILDDPAVHIRVSKFQVSPLSPQGVNSIALFQLHDERQVRARRKMYLSDQYERLPIRLQNLLDRVLSR